MGNKAGVSFNGGGNYTFFIGKPLFEHSHITAHEMLGTFSILFRYKLINLKLVF